MAVFLARFVGRCKEQLEESLAIKRALGDSRGIAHSLNPLGLLAKQQGDLATAERLHREALGSLSSRSRWVMPWPV